MTRTVYEGVENVPVPVNVQPILTSPVDDSKKQPLRRSLESDLGRHADTSHRKRQDSVGSASESIDSRIPMRDPGTAERERRYMEAKRLELAELRKQNEKTCYQAIHFPDVAGRGGSVLHNHRSENVTVPHEFNLSVNSRATSRSVSSECERSKSGRSSSRQWRPELTIPEGPNLRTASRSQSRNPSDRSGSRAARENPTPARSCRSDMSLVSPSPGRSVTSLRSSRSMGTRGLTSAQLPLQPPMRFGTSRGRSATPQSTPARSCCSVRSTSDMSIASMASRMSKLSMRSTSSRRGPSTEDRQLLQAEAGRLELKNLMAHNARTYKEAIERPHVSEPRSVGQPTIPHEFNLSVSNIPASRSRAASVCSSECGSDTSRARSSRRKPWQPQLTVPQTPNLETARRARSTNASRREGSSDPKSRSLSAHRNRVPLREQDAIERHIEQRTQKIDGGSGRVDPSRQQRGANGRGPALQPPPGCKDLQQWVRDAATAEEQAERARAVAFCQTDAKWAEKNRLCVFKVASGGSADSLS